MKIDINKPDVYRKAAEVLIRDGRVQGDLVEVPKGVTEEEGFQNPQYAVCALGACARAVYELYGLNTNDPYDYEFTVYDHKQQYDRKIWSYNDDDGYSDEDIALLLKQHAHYLEEAGNDA